jgi:proline iminopeptidase
MKHRFLSMLFAAGICSGQAVSATDPDRDTWYLPTTDGAAKLFVEELGSASAPAVIVLHGGWGAEHSYLDDVVRPLADSRHSFCTISVVRCSRR